MRSNQGELVASAVAVRADQEMFFEQLAAAPSRMLLLDYDGTIAPFAVDRNRAIPYPSVAELLDCIGSTCKTRVVLISGRSARQVPPLLGLNPHPEILGTHGFERLYPDGRYETGLVLEAAKQALDVAEWSLEGEGLAHTVERKVGAVAVHWRGRAEAEIEEIRTKAYQVLAPQACEARLLLNEFDGGLELRLRSCTKDHAVRALLCEVPGDAPVAYLGDDFTDEDAFRALNGRGLTVLVRPTPRTTAAQMWLRPPEELVQFLADWVRACGGDV